LGKAEGWLNQVTEDLYCLGVPFNLYLLKAEEPILIEGGLSPLYSLLEEGARTLGFGLEEIRRAFVLHAHADHLMALSVLKGHNPEVRIYGSSEAQRALSRDKVWERFKAVGGQTGEALRRELGLPRPPEGSRVFVEEVLEDGQVLDLGGHELKVLSTPGHSPCSISLLLDGEVLLVSDALGGWLHRSPTGPRPNPFWNLEQYISSAKKLEAVPCSALCLGHNGFLLGRERIEAFFRGFWRNLNDFIEEVSLRVKGVEDFQREKLRYAEMWHTDFLRFFPPKAHLEAVQVLLLRTVEFLGRNDLVKALKETGG